MKGNYFLVRTYIINALFNSVISQNWFFASDTGLLEYEEGLEPFGYDVHLNKDTGTEVDETINGTISIENTTTPPQHLTSNHSDTNLNDEVHKYSTIERLASHRAEKDAAIVEKNNTKRTPESELITEETHKHRTFHNGKATVHFTLPITVNAHNEAIPLNKNKTIINRAVWQNKSRKPQLYKAKLRRKLRPSMQNMIKKISLGRHAVTFNASNPQRISPSRVKEPGDINFKLDPYEIDNPDFRYQLPDPTIYNDANIYGINPNDRRMNKFLDVLQVVRFDHVACISSSGLEGTCLHQIECQAALGIAMGDCADGFGVCCVMQYSCGEETGTKLGWFVNPGYPSPSTDRMSCSLAINKAANDIVQIRLDFQSFELLPPTEGSCAQDQFVVSGQNINSLIPIICGVNNNQHMYIEVGDVAGPIHLSIQTVSEESRLFAIKITQLTATDDVAAPPGCLQYFTDFQGHVESLGYQDKSALAISKLPTYFNNLNYAVCIRRNPGICSITYSNADVFQIVNYDLDGLLLIPPEQAGVEIFNCPSDYILAGAVRLCGERLNDGAVIQDFGQDAPVTDNTAGPIIIWFRTDGAGAGRGFKLHYMQNACASI